MHKQQGWPQAWEYCQAKLIQTLVRASQGVDWSWSQCIKSHHAQKSSGKGLPSHFWTRDNVRSILPGLWRKITQWSKVLFSDESKFCISFGNQGPRVWRKAEITESMLIEVQCEVSTVSDDLGCHVICWCWSTVFSEVHSQRSHLPGNFRALPCFLLLTSFMEMLISFSSRTWHLPTLPKVPKAGIYGVLSRGRWETPDPTMQMSWRPLSKKPGLPYHLSSATNWSPPCHAELRQ